VTDTAGFVLGGSGLDHLSFSTRTQPLIVSAIIVIFIFIFIWGDIFSGFIY
jgi:hypothetical protein